LIRLKRLAPKNSNHSEVAPLLPLLVHLVKEMRTERQTIIRFTLPVNRPGHASRW